MRAWQLVAILPLPFERRCWCDFISAPCACLQTHLCLHVLVLVPGCAVPQRALVSLLCQRQSPDYSCLAYAACQPPRHCSIELGCQAPITPHSALAERLIFPPLRSPVELHAVLCSHEAPWLCDQLSTQVRAHVCVSAALQRAYEMVRPLC